MYNYLHQIVLSIAAVVIDIDVFGVKKRLATVLVFSGEYIVTQSKWKVSI